MIPDTPGTNIHKDADGSLTHVSHLRAPVLNRELGADPLGLALWYVTDRQNAELYDLAGFTVQAKTVEPESEVLRPNKDESPYTLRLRNIKSMRDTTVVTLQQTLFGIDVWEAVFTVMLQKDSTSGAYYIVSSSSSLRRKIAEEPGFHVPDDQDPFLPDKIKIEELSNILKPTAGEFITSIEKRRLLYYQYDRALWLKNENDKRDPDDIRVMQDAKLDYFQVAPPSPEAIAEKRHYPVSEIIFTTRIPKTELDVSWQALIDVRRGEVLKLWPFATGCIADMFPQPSLANPDAMGMVMCADPRTMRGENPIPPNTSPTTADMDALDAALRAFCNPMPLTHLVPKEHQQLNGFYATLTDQGLSPGMTMPEESRANNALPMFDYDAYEDGQRFTATNAYYHTESLFRMMESLGFADLRTGYFELFGPSSHTGPLVAIDPLGWWSSNEKIGAWTTARVTGSGYQPTISFGSTQHDSPIGTGTDIRVVLHEFCHLLLLAHLGNLNFGFAHSAGDSLAAILMDPDSALRESASDRFLTYPWLVAQNPQIPDATIRYHGGNEGQRLDPDEWGWQSQRYQNDVSYGYITEQVLSITLFKLYCALGGDSPIVERRRLAARYTTYLIIQAISVHSRPGMLANYIDCLQAADLTQGAFSDPDLSNITRGIAQKVIDWAFRTRGFDTTGGNTAQSSDVYIDDGRDGEYDYTNDFSGTEIWNRVGPSAAAVNPGPDTTNPLNNHQPPSLTPGDKNFIYARIKNKGAGTAQSVTVKAYYRMLPQNADASELLWDDQNWTAATPSTITPTNNTIPGNSDQIIGPFEWNAGNTNQQVCILVSVSSANDPSLIDPYPTPTTFRYRQNPTKLWWLVPQDNNIAYTVFGLHRSTIAVPQNRSEIVSENHDNPNANTTAGANTNAAGNTTPPQGLTFDNNPPIIPPFVSEVVTNLEPPPTTIDPNRLPVCTVPPPDVVVLWGYVGDVFSYTGNSAFDDRQHIRLYRTLQLNEYLEIRVIDILYAETTSYFGGLAQNILWVKPDANMRYIYTGTVQAQLASFLQGPLMSPSMGGGYGGGMQGGNGGVSFACPGGGVSFACPGGGVSFACPGGGVSFACPGGGVSFACPGGGVSFACPGGGVSFACPGGGVSFAGCR